MKLIIGGCSQGKLNYVLTKIDEKRCRILDGALPEHMDLDRAESDTADTIVVINHLHELIRTLMQQGENPQESIMNFITRFPDCILISDEIGNGIVPMDAFEREYREQTGRILIELAKEAEEVIRVLCGIGQKIK